MSLVTRLSLLGRNPAAPNALLPLFSRRCASHLSAIHQGLNRSERVRPQGSSPRKEIRQSPVDEPYLSPKERRQARALARQNPITYKIRKGKKDITQEPGPPRKSRSSRFLDPRDPLGKKSLVKKFVTGQLFDGRESANRGDREGNLQHDDFVRQMTGHTEDQPRPPKSSRSLHRDSISNFNESQRPRAFDKGTRDRESGPWQKQERGEDYRPGRTTRDGERNGGRLNGFNNELDRGGRSSQPLIDSPDRDQSRGARIHESRPWQNQARDEHYQSDRAVRDGARDDGGMNHFDNKFDRGGRNERTLYDSPDRDQSRGARSHESRPWQKQDRDEDYRPGRAVRDGAKDDAGMNRFDNKFDRGGRNERPRVDLPGRDRRPTSSYGSERTRNTDTNDFDEAETWTPKRNDGPVSMPYRATSSYGSERTRTTNPKDFDSVETWKPKRNDGPVSMPYRATSSYGSERTRTTNPKDFDSVETWKPKRNDGPVSMPYRATSSYGSERTRNTDTNDFDEAETWTPKRNDGPVSIPYSTAASQFLYGTSTVEAALKAGRRKLYRLYIYKGRGRSSRALVKDEMLGDLARAKGIKVEYVQEESLPMLNKMSESRPHNGHVLEASPLPQLPVTALQEFSDEQDKPGFELAVGHQSYEEAEVNGDSGFIGTARGSHKPLVLVVDQVVDPGNLGAMLRTASFMGVTAVAVSKKGSSPVTPVVLKASAGAAEVLNILSIDSVEDFIRDSKDHGWKVYAACPPKSESKRPQINTISLEKSDPLLNHPCILLVGSEGEGLPRPLRRIADVEVSIPNLSGSDVVDSLNVSVAAGLLCSAFLKGKARATENSIRDPGALF